MTSPLETFELFAELSLALAGFSGVAAAFGGREREFRPIERSRLTSVFQFSATSLAGALLVISLTHANVAPGQTYAVACIVSGLLVLSISCIQFPLVFKTWREGKSTTSRRFLLGTFCFLASLILMYFWAALYERESWPLVSGISAQLMYGLWMFARLLLRAN